MGSNRNISLKTQDQPQVWRRGLDRTKTSSASGGEARSSLLAPGPPPHALFHVKSTWCVHPPE